MGYWRHALWRGCERLLAKATRASAWWHRVHLPAQPRPLYALVPLKCVAGRSRRHFVLVTGVLRQGVALDAEDDHAHVGNRTPSESAPRNTSGSRTTTIPMLCTRGSVLVLLARTSVLT